MRSHAKLTLGASIAVCACLVVTVSAQKGKPAPAPTYVWSVTLGSVAGRDPIFASGELKRDATANWWSNTTLRLIIPPILGSSSRSGSGDTSKWIGFRDLVPNSWTLETGLNPICQYPVFDDDGVRSHGW